MLSRKLIAEALRVENKDVLPKFGSPELKAIREGQEQIKITDVIDGIEGTIKEDGIFSIMDALERGSVGIVDTVDNPALSFRKVGQEIQAHNLFTDEDDILDVTPEALKDYIYDQILIEHPKRVNAMDEAIKEEHTYSISNGNNSEYDTLVVVKDDNTYRIVEGDFVHDVRIGFKTLQAAVDAYLAMAKKNGYVDPKAVKEIDESEEDVDITNVIFKREPNQDTDEIDVLAVFPDEISHIGDESYVTVYSHNGQHGDASEEYVNGLEDATEEEYADLAEELRERGYNLNILNGIQEEPSQDVVDIYDGTYHEESPLEVPVGYALDEADNKNYAVVKFKDVGNGAEILDVIEGYASTADALKAIDDMQMEPEFEDPTLGLFVAYSDGTAWYDAATGEELEFEGSGESPETEVNDIIADVKAQCQISSDLNERINNLNSMDASAVHELLMDLRDEVEGKVSGSLYNRLDDIIDDLYDDEANESVLDNIKTEDMESYSLDDFDLFKSQLLTKMTPILNDYEKDSEEGSGATVDYKAAGTLGEFVVTLYIDNDKYEVASGKMNEDYLSEFRSDFNNGVYDLLNVKGA